MARYDVVISASVEVDASDENEAFYAADEILTALRIKADEKGLKLWAEITEIDELEGDSNG